MRFAIVRRITQAVNSALLVLLSACSATRVGVVVPVKQNEPLVKGPAVMDVSTPFDRALTCLDGRINKDALRFAVGAIVDATGKEQVTDGGSGKFVTQGAGDIVQSALFLAGATVVNRRDPRIIENDVKWGLLDTKKQEPTTFFITGSINSLDFLPGSGFDVQIAGVGPRSRQNRILVGLDLSLTEARTGRIVANVPLQKQVVATEDGFGVGRFFGNTLVSLDIGGKEREALNLVLRQMLNLATFELLTQVMNPAKYGDCMQLIEQVDGVTDNSRSKRKLVQYLNEQTEAAKIKARGRPGLLEEAGKAQAQAAPPPQAGVSPVTALDPNMAAREQRPYFKEEQTELSPAAFKALELRSSGLTSANGNGNEAYAGAPPGGAATLAAVLVNGNGALASSPGCNFAAGDFLQVTPLRATESGETLRIKSRSTQTLCLADSSGNFEPRTLLAGVEQKFQGRPPWKLQAGNMAELEIIFQGFPLRKPGYVKDRMELLERS